MKKTRSDAGSPNLAPNLLNAFSGLLRAQQQDPPSPPSKTAPVPSEIPQGYDLKKFSKLIAKHDRISREIDRKYNGGKPLEK